MKSPEKPQLDEASTVVAAQSFEGISDAREAKRMRVSPVLLLPLVVLVVLGALLYSERQKEGVKVVIEFATSGGISEGTTLKFRDVAMGRVSSVVIDEASDKVQVSAQVAPQFASRLKRARFWVVRPTIKIHEVSGLETLITGPYIAMDEGRATEAVARRRVFRFVGLEEAPVEINGGLRVTLAADRVGSVRKGSPILFRQFPVGSVIKSRLNPESEKVEFDIVIEKEYARLVTANCRFWNASGIGISLADGLEIQAESLDTLISGGIAFAVPAAFKDVKGAAVVSGAAFDLYDDEEAVAAGLHGAPEYYDLFFEGSVRGLDEGSPVLFRGVKVGEVTEIRLEHSDNNELEIPVTIRLDFDHIARRVTDDSGSDKSRWNDLVDRGLRARLDIGNLLTGSLYVSLDFNDKKEGYIRSDWAKAQLPTLRSPIDQVISNIGDLKIPTLVNQFANTLTTIQDRMDDFEALATGESKTMELLRETLEQISSTARSVRVMADAIEQDPQSFIFGK